MIDYFYHKDTNEINVEEFINLAANVKNIRHKIVRLLWDTDEQYDNALLQTGYVSKYALDLLIVGNRYTELGISIECIAIRHNNAETIYIHTDEGNIKFLLDDDEIRINDDNLYNILIADSIDLDRNIISVVYNNKYPFNEVDEDFMYWHKKQVKADNKMLNWSDMIMVVLLIVMVIRHPSIDNGILAFMAYVTFNVIRLGTTYAIGINQHYEYDKYINHIKTFVKDEE